MNKTDQILKASRQLASIGTEGLIIPNHSGDHDAGRMRRTPVNDTDLVNKAYADSLGVTISSPDGSITVGGTAQAPTLAVVGKTGASFKTQQAFSAYPSTICGWGDGLTFNLPNYHTATGLQNFSTDASEAGYQGLINDVVSYGTKAFSIDSTGANGDYTTDIWATRAVMTTLPANCTAVKDADLRGDNGILVGTTGATPGAWYSTNAGKDWTQTGSAIGTNAIACCLYDANNGFLIINTTKRVWVTANGGNTWADSGFAFDTTRLSGSYPRVYALASNCVMMVDEYGQMGFMYTATGTAYYLTNKSSSTATGVSNVLKIGTSYYWVLGGYGTQGSFLCKWGGVASNEVEYRFVPHSINMSSSGLPYLRKIAYVSSSSIAVMVGTGLGCVGLIGF